MRISGTHKRSHSENHGRGAIHFFSFGLPAFVITLLILPASALALTSSEAIKELKEIQSRVRTKIDETDKSIMETIKKSRFIKMKDLLKDDNDFAFRSIQDQVLRLKDRRNEYILRNQFLNELLNKFTTGFSGQNPKEFLETQLLEMSVTAIGVGTNETNLNSNYWQFLMYASVAIREIPEQIENVFKFLETYMDFSTISKPRSPSDFRQQRNYFNSRRVESGKPAQSGEWEGAEPTVTTNPKADESKANGKPGETKSIDNKPVTKSSEKPKR